MKKGTLFIISAPSGAGKTSLVSEILERVTNIKASISHTTRKCRPGEMDGINYHFVDEPTFAGMVKKNAFLEYAEVFGNHYGTSQERVQLTLEEGVDVILEIDWQGAEQVRQHFSKSISIFILPPSIQALKDRLNDRGQDNADVIQHRIAAAKEEMSHYADADYLVVNDDFEFARHQLEAIIIAQRCHLDIMSAEPILSDLLS